MTALPPEPDALPPEPDALPPEGPDAWLAEPDATAPRLPPREALSPLDPLALRAERPADATGDAPPPPPAAPVRSAERIYALDVLRGLALFGILTVNMALFSASLYTTYLRPHVWPDWWDRVAESAVCTLAEGKFYPLFALLFGIGFALQMGRLTARSAHPTRLYVRRLLVLLAFGALHAFLLWYGDVLMLYALLGFVLLALRRVRSWLLITMAVVAYVAPLVWLGGATAVAAAVAAADPNVAAAQEESAVTADENTWAYVDASDDAYAHGTFREICAQRLRDHQEALAGVIYMAPVVLAMFLTGLVIARGDLLTAPDRHRTLLRRLAWIALPLGTLANAAYAYLSAVSDWLRDFGTWAGGYILHALGVPGMVFGAAAVVLLALQHAGWRRLLSPVAAAGRMALTNYITQTLVCTTLFYSYGWGWFGRVGPARGLLIAVVLYALQLPLSVLWLRWFRFGPLEWVWRTLTYLRWQPLRRTAGSLPPAVRDEPG
jgi:uncharacterized protein